MVNFVTHVRPIFYEMFKVFVVTNQKLCELKIGMSDKHHRHSKHTKFRQNLRGPYNSLVIGHGMTQRVKIHNSAKK